MSYTIECPICHRVVTSSEPSGRCSCDGHCGCNSDIYCNFLEERVCGDKECWKHYIYGYDWLGSPEISLKRISCDECNQNSTTECEDYRYCDGRNGEECSDSSCGRQIEGCGWFYYHPIWHKAIRCYNCASFDVEPIGDSIWNFKCNNCGNEFELTDKHNKKNNSKKLNDKIQEEKNKLELLRGYKEMLDNGIISQEEFEVKKKEILNLFKK